MGKCEWCNKEFDDKNGKYRFCSHSCRSKNSASKVKNRKTPFVKGCGYVKAKEGGWKCPYCEEVFRTRREKQEHVKQIHPDRIGIGWNKGLTKESNASIAKGANTYKNRYEKR